MRTINAADVTPADKAYCWTDAGDGKLYPVNYFRHDGWLICGLFHHGDSLTTSFCVCDDSPVYSFETDEERNEYEQTRREELAARRKQWDSEHRHTCPAARLRYGWE